MAPLSKRLVDTISRVDLLADVGKERSALTDGHGGHDHVDLVDEISRQQALGEARAVLNEDVAPEARFSAPTSSPAEPRASREFFQVTSRSVVEKTTFWTSSSHREIATSWAAAAATGRTNRVGLDRDAFLRGVQSEIIKGA